MPRRKLDIGEVFLQCVILYGCLNLRVQENSFRKYGTSHESFCAISCWTKLKVYCMLDNVLLAVFGVFLHDFSLHTLFQMICHKEDISEVSLFCDCKNVL